MKTHFMAIATAGLLTAATPGFASPAADELAQLEALVASERDNVRALNDLGALHLDANRLDQAETRFREALAVPPHYAIGPFLFGDIYTDAEHYQAAIDDYRKIIDQNAEYARARNLLGRILLAREQTTAARLEFEEALKINPEYGEARANLRLAMNSVEPSDSQQTQRGQESSATEERPALAAVNDETEEHRAWYGNRELPSLSSGEPARALLSRKPAEPHFQVRQAFAREEVPVLTAPTARPLPFHTVRSDAEESAIVPASAVEAAPAAAGSVEFSLPPASPEEAAPPSNPAPGHAAESPASPPLSETADAAGEVQTLKADEADGPDATLTRLTAAAPETLSETAIASPPSTEESLWDENTQEPKLMAEWLFQYPK